MAFRYYHIHIHPSGSRGYRLGRDIMHDTTKDPDAINLMIDTDTGIVTIINQHFETLKPYSITGYLPTGYTGQRGLDSPAGHTGYTGPVSYTYPPTRHVTGPGYKKKRKFLPKHWALFLLILIIIVIAIAFFNDNPDY